MPYLRRSRPRYRKSMRRPRRKARTTGKVASTAVLTKRVNTLARRIRTNSDVHYCYRSATGGTIGTPYASVNICRYADLFNASGSGGPLFGSSALDFDNINKIKHYSFTFQFKIDIANEPANVDYTCALISFKKNAQQLYNPTTGTLNITDGPHYRLTGGMCMLNKQLMNIHYYRRFTMGNNNIALTTVNGVGDTTRICINDYVKIKPNKFITNPGIVGTNGDIDQLQADMDPTGQYYFLIFNNNSTADLESPSIDWQSVHKFISYS